MNYYIEIIDHSEQDYPTTGNWFRGQIWGEDGGEITTEHCAGDTLIVQVSKMGDWRYEFLVGVHELLEAALCKHAGVDEKTVTAFDVAFEHLRDRMKKKLAVHEGDFLNDIRGIESWRALKANIDAEPGDCSEAPYYQQHQFATGIEHVLAAKLGVNWAAYEKANNDLYE